MLHFNPRPSLKKLGLLAAFACTMSVGSAEAVSFGQTATIDALPAITVVQTQQLNFGQVQIPASGTETAIITTNSGTGTGTITYFDDTVTDGVFTIGGSASNTINLQASGTDADGIVWTDFTGDYNAGGAVDIDDALVTTLAAPGAGLTLRVGATITVANTTSEGTITPAYNLEFSYD